MDKDIEVTEADIKALNEYKERCRIELEGENRTLEYLKEAFENFVRVRRLNAPFKAYQYEMHEHLTKAISYQNLVVRQHEQTYNDISKTKEQ